MKKHFHPITALLFLRRTLVLYLLPLINVLLAGDLAALRDALRQDAAIFAVLLAVSAVMLISSGWQLGADGTLNLYWSLGVRHRRCVFGGSLAALKIERPVLFRLLGASRVTVYPEGSRRGVSLCVARRDARLLADALMPSKPLCVHHPRGGERMALAVLGANGVSTLALLVLARHESRGFWPALQDAAIRHLSQLAAFAGRWLPAGTAWLLALAALLLGLSLARSAAHAARCEVWRSEKVFGSRGGLLSLYEYRLALDSLSMAEVRTSVFSRLLGCGPVYCAAGGFRSELPLFVYMKGGESLAAELLPGFVIAPEKRAEIKDRSLMFFAPAGVPCFCFLLLAVMAFRLLPAVALPFLLLAAACVPPLYEAARGFFLEGASVRGERLTLCRQRGIHTSLICVFSPRACLTAQQTPWAAAAQRADLTVKLPGGVKESVRSIPLADAEKCFDLLEGKL